MYYRNLRNLFCRVLKIVTLIFKEFNRFMQDFKTCDNTHTLLQEVTNSTHPSFHKFPSSLSKILLQAQHRVQNPYEYVLCE